MEKTPTDQARSEQTVTELVGAARAGDPRAWAELVRRYGEMVHAVASSYRLQPADTADAVQNTWVRALERLGTLREPERLGGWLSTIASREALAVLRAGRRQMPDDGIADMLVATGPGPDAVALGAERASAVTQAVSRLEDRHRRLVDVLFADEGYSYREVAGRMGMPIGSIGPTRGRVMDDLRVHLGRAGFGPEDVAA